MNKKFSTLVAGILLASSIGTVNADVISGDFAKYATAPVAAQAIKAGTYYQLAAGNDGKVVAMLPKANSDGYILKTVSKDDAKLTDVRYTLWTINVEGNPTDGYRYSFVNLGAQMILAVDPSTALKATSTSAAATEVKGDISVWKWQDAPDPVGGFKLDGTKELTSVFGAKNDSTVTLASGDNGLYAVKYALNNKDAANLSTDQIKIVPAKPAAVVLGADDLNSMLWSTTTDGKVKLTFNKEVEGGNPEAVNLFTKQTYKAVPVVGFPANYTSVADFVRESNDALKLAYTMDNTNQGELDNEYKAMFESEAASYNASAKAAFANAIKGILDKDKNGSTTYHTAVWGVYQGIGQNVTNSTSTPLTLEQITEKVNAVTLEKVKAVTGVTDLDKVSDDILSSTLATFKSALLASLNAHAFNKGFNGVAQTVYSELMGANQVVDQIVKANENYASKVKEYVTASNEAQDAYDKAVATAHDKFVKGATKYGWVSLQANYGEDEEASYLAVDTAFLTKDAGAKHLALAIKNFKDKNVRPNNEDRTRLDLNGRFNFQFVWHPASDSIVIRTAGFAKKADKTPYWSMMNATDNPNDLGMWKANVAAKGTKYKYTEIDKTHEGAELNLIKIQVLADNHREVTVGSSEFTASENDPSSTINTCISINGNGIYTKTTIPEGVYYFNLVSNLPWRSNENGKYIVADFCGQTKDYVKPETDQIYGQAQNFDHMPRTHWVIEQNAGPVASERTINIYNREFPKRCAKNVQVYTDGNGHVFALFGNYRTPLTYVSDTVSYTAVSADVLKKNYGYKVLDEKDLLHYRYTMDYYSGMGIGHKVNVSAVEADSIVFVNAKEDAAGVPMQLIAAAGVEKYGYKGDVVDQLERQLYKIRTYDSSKLSNNNKYVKVDWTNWDSYVLADEEENAATFYLKENNQLTVDGKTICYYALVEKAVYDNEEYLAYRAGVRDGSLELSAERPCDEKRVATFSVEADNTPYYRRLGATNKEDGFKDMDVANAKIYDVLTNEYLYEDATSDYSKNKSINFLGIENKKVTAKTPTLYVDTAFVRGETLMPQYMLAVGVKVYEEGKYCPYDPEHNTDEYLAEHPEGCPHAIPTQGYKVGRYLVNFADSVALSDNAKHFQYDANYTRLGFVEAKHIGDTLVIYRNGVPGTTAADSIFLGDNQHNMPTWTLPSKTDPSKNTKADTIRAAHQHGIKNAVFAFRLVDDAPEADFLIESEGEKAIPENGGWVKNQNGVPVIAHYASYREAALDALVFNIEPSSEEAVANESIATSAVSVIAGNGKIIIKGAAGKKVAISNVLGQTIANTVITSDEATIAAPAGVVVVAVEGEAAVKAIVK